MSNPALTRAFETHVHTTPAGYPTYPGYQPGGAQQTSSGTTAGTTQPGQYGQYLPPQQPGQTDMSQFEYAYQQPPAQAADTERLTMDDVVVRTSLTLGTVVVAGALSWWLALSSTALIPALMWGGMLVGFVLGMVNSFKKEPSPALILTYAAAEGVFLGALSMMFNAMWPGIAMQAVLATVVTFAVTLGVYKSGMVKVNQKFVKFVTIALISYLAFSLLNQVLMLTGVASGMFGLMSGTAGLVIGALAVLLATFSLMVDFKSVEDGIAAGVPRRYSWSAAFGLTVTLVWLYVEFLRLIAIFRGE